MRFNQKENFVKKSEEVFAAAMTEESLSFRDI